MAEYYMGQLLPFAGNFVINGTAAANGDLVPVSQNTALYSIIGTNYGGDGVATFALPDLRGRLPIGTGTRPGASTYVIGQSGGTEFTTLSVNQMPAHNHLASTSGLAVNTSGLTVNTSGMTATLKAVAASGSESSPGGNSLAQISNGYAEAVATDALSASSIALGGSATIGGTASVSGNVSIGMAGGSQPVPLLNPYLAITWLVVTQGLYPSKP